MANEYTLKFSDPAKESNEIIVLPQTRNNYDTSLDLVGAGYVAYGEPLAQNFLKLLENFASPNPPPNPIEGQLWYDTSDPQRKILRINNGAANSARWPSANGIYQQAVDPTVQYSQNVVEGDIWVDTGNTQLKIRYGDEWRLVGPALSSNEDKTGSEVVNLISNTNETYPVILNWVNGKVVEIISYNEFTPRTVIDGFSVLKPGLNITNRVSAKFNGLADRAKALEISPGVLVQASEVLKNKIPTGTRQVHDGTLVVQSPAGLVVKRQNGQEIQIYTTASGAIINYENSVSILKVGINNASYIRFNGATGNVGINTSTNESVALSVNGAATFKNNITITSPNTTTVGINVSGSAVVDGNLNLSGNLRVTGLTTISNVLTVADILPSNLIRSIGSAAQPFERIYVKNIGSSTTYVKIFGSVTTATVLETPRPLRIVGQFTSSVALFDGSTSATFITTATRALISEPAGGTTTSTTITQTLLVLDTATVSSSLQSISKENFLSDVYPFLVQTGMIIPSGTSTSYQGFLLCDGGVYTQTSYTSLFTKIGTRYGTGVAPGTFRVPNLMNVTTSSTASFVASIFYHIKT